MGYFISRWTYFLLILAYHSTRAPEVRGSPVLRRPRQAIYESEWISPPSSPLIALSPPAFLPFLFSNQNFFPSTNVAQLPSNVVDQSNWDIWTGDSFGVFNGSWFATTQFPLFPN